MSEIKVNKISPRTNCGTVTLGDSGDTITIPAGVTITNNGTQTGFGREGSVDWQTSSIKTTTFTAVKVVVFIELVCQSTEPSLPKPVCVPLFVIVTPAGIVIVSPLSPNVTVPQFVLGLILFTFISLIIYLLKLIPYYYYTRATCSTYS